MKFLRCLTLFLGAMALNLTVAHAQSVWRVLGKSNQNQRYIFVDGLKYDQAQTGDFLRIDSPGGEPEVREIVFTIYSAGKTAFLFKSGLTNPHKNAVATVARKQSRTNAPSNLNPLGVAYLDRSMKKSIPAGSKKVWVNSPLYRMVKTNDKVTFVDNYGKQEVSTIQHVVSHSNATMLIFKKPIVNTLIKPTLHKGIYNSDESTFGNIFRELENFTNQNNSSNTTPSGGGSSSSTSNASQSTQQELPSGTQIYALSVYQGDKNRVGGTHPQSNVRVAVKNTGKPMVLSLNSYEKVNWQLDIEPGANIKEVLLSGYYQQTVQNLPGGVLVTRFSYEEGNYNQQLNQFGKEANSEKWADFRTFINTTYKEAPIAEIQSSYYGEAGFSVPQTSINTPTPAEMGKLKIEPGSTVFSDLLVANQVDAEILKIRLNAEKDDIHLSRLFFKSNNANTSVPHRFKIYSSQGQHGEAVTINNGELQFNFGANDKIEIPKDGSIEISVRADTHNINSASESGEILSLELDTSKGYGGFEGILASSGNRVPNNNITINVVKSQDFLITKSKLSVRHAAYQPSFFNPNALSQEVYRFTVTADSAGKAELSKLKIQLDLQGMQFSQAPDYQILKVENDGTLNNRLDVAQAFGGNVSAGAISDTITAQFSNQIINAGSSVTYALLVNHTTDGPIGESDDDAFITRFLNDYSPANTKTKSELSAANLIWSDHSGNGQKDYFNGYLVRTESTAFTNQD